MIDVRPTAADRSTGDQSVILHFDLGKQDGGYVRLATKRSRLTSKYLEKKKCNLPGFEPQNRMTSINALLGELSQLNKERVIVKYIKQKINVIGYRHVLMVITGIRGA